MPVVEAIATAVPGPAVPQSELKEQARAILGSLDPSLVRYLDIFDHAGIDTRHFVRPLDWYLEPHGWDARAEAFRDDGLALLETVATRALRNARVPVDAVDGIVLVNTTGISTPSLEARLMNRLPFRADISRLPVWGLGCAGGVAGLRIAGDLAAAHPDRRYLLLSMELCSLAFHLNDLSVRAFVAATLFSDGAAAALVRGDDLQGDSLARIVAGGTHTWPDSEDVMGWDVTEDGLRVVFSRQIPELVTTRLGPVVESFLKRHGRATTPPVASADSARAHAPRDPPAAAEGLRHVLHPGGMKILDGYATALPVTESDLDASRTVLRRYGNMSSPSVLFVLQESLRRAPLARGEGALLAALGPGFATELALLEG